MISNRVWWNYGSMPPSWCNDFTYNQKKYTDFNAHFPRQGREKFRFHLKNFQWKFFRISLETNLSNMCASMYVCLYVDIRTSIRILPMTRWCCTFMKLHRHVIWRANCTRIIAFVNRRVHFMQIAQKVMTLSRWSERQSVVDEDLRLTIITAG